jgi:hypothetical protein
MFGVQRVTGVQIRALKQRFDVRALWRLPLVLQ